jgi:twitching motility two-component system response regulator PilH
MKILIVDDARWQRAHLHLILTSAGHEVIQAADGAEGLDRLEDAPDAVICDLLMPNLDGFGFLAGARQRGVTIPIVIASADVQRTSRERCMELGARAFVAKPYQARDILDAVGTAMAA